MRHPNLLRTRGSYESLNGPNGELNDVWPIRPTRGVNRGYQFGILRADGTLAKYTSVCTPMVYRGDRLPAELYGNVFVVDPTVNLVSRIILGDSGSGLTADKAYRDVRGEFLASTDERFRPVNLSLAPDGTLYVVDMYRGIIQHKGYMTEYLRDYVLTHKLEQPNSFGRIYRDHAREHEARHDAAADASARATAQLVSAAVASERLAPRHGAAAARRAWRQVGCARAAQAGVELGRSARAAEGAVGARWPRCDRARVT